MRIPLRSATAAVLALALVAGCGDTEEVADDATTPVPETGEDTVAGGDTDAGEDPGVGEGGGGVTPDNPDQPDAGDPPGTGTIPATLVIDGESLVAEACEVTAGSIRVRAGSSPVDPGVVVGGGADGAAMTLLGLDGSVEALTVEFEAVADDADEYRGTFDPAATDGMETIEASYNVGVPPCPDGVGS